MLSESEWEYVARAGVTKKYSIGEEGSDDITHKDARYKQSDVVGTVPVGSYEPNKFGLYDVHGNVAEWVQDCWHFAYALTVNLKASLEVDPTLSRPPLLEPTANTSGLLTLVAPNDGSVWSRNCQSPIFLRDISSLLGLEGNNCSWCASGIPSNEIRFAFYRGGNWNTTKDRLEVTYRGNAVRKKNDQSGTAAITFTRDDVTGFRIARTIAPKLTSPPSGTAINIQSTSAEVRVVIEAESAATISLELAADGELVVNPPSSPISLALNVKEALFTLTAVGGGSTTLTLTVRDLFGGEDTRNIRVDGPNIYPEMVKVTSGTFLMGRPPGEGGDGNERPTRDVTFSYSFAVGKFELTQAQYGAFVTATGRRASRDWDTGNGKHPVANIRVSDVEAYIIWLNGITGQKYRLLSESEWEYAARAGTTTRYSNGSDSITTQTANYNNSSGGAVEVGRYPANAWGLHDVHGNVSEWIADCWHQNYKNNNPPTDGSVWDSNCDEDNRNVHRGGSYREAAIGIRAAKRFSQNSITRAAKVGVRIARILEASDPNSP